MWHSSDRLNLVLFSLFFFYLAALFKSSSPNALVHNRRGRNAHSRVKRKQLLLRWRRIVLFWKTFIDFRVVVVVFCHYLLFFSCSSSVLVCVHAFPGAVICDLQLKEEGKQKQFVGFNFLFFFWGGGVLSFHLCFFFFVAFTSLGEEAVVL